MAQAVLSSRLWGSWSRAERVPAIRMTRLEQLVAAAGPLTLAGVQAASRPAAAILAWALAVAGHC